MVKSISGGLNTHIQQDVTTLARCWKLVRTDGVAFYFTAHDADLLFEGNTYISKAGFSSTAIANANDFSVDNMDVQGLFDDDAIKDVELSAGKFDYADVYIFFVNWQDTTQGPLKMRRGFLGEVVSSATGYFKVEIRGLTQLLQQKIVEMYGPECRADLGDSRCKVPINPPLRQNTTAYALGDYIRVSTNGGLGGQAQYENRIYKCTQAGITAAAPVTYDTVVGHTTSEGGVRATATLLVASNVLDTQTLILDGKTYTFQTVLTNVDGHVQIGASAALTAQNLLDAIMLTGTPGTQYAAATTIHTTLGANNRVSATFTLYALLPGTAGCAITLGGGGAPTFGLVVFNGVPGPTGTMNGGLETVVFTTVEAWTRNAVIATVTDHKNFTITITEPRDVDGWFTYGKVYFVDGSNIGKTTEIKSWAQAGTAVTLFLNLPYLPVVGDKIAIEPGCNMSLTACKSKFNNLLNMRAESYVPGNDQAFRPPDITR